MINADARELALQVAETTLQGKNQIRLGEIHSKPLPRFIQMWFQSIGDQLYAKEIKARRNQSRFNYDDPAVKVVAAKFDKLVKDTTVFSAVDFLKYTERAIDQELTYLIHPVQALLTFFFRNTNEEPCGRIIEYLRHTRRERHYIDALKAYSQGNRSRGIEANTLEQILTRAEDHRRELDPIGLLITAAQACAELLILMSHATNEQIDREIWEAFFELRNAHHLKAALDLAKERNLQALTCEELEQLLHVHRMVLARSAEAAETATTAVTDAPVEVPTIEEVFAEVDLTTETVEAQPPAPPQPPKAEPEAVSEEPTEATPETVMEESGVPPEPVAGPEAGLPQVQPGAPATAPEVPAQATLEEPSPAEPAAAVELSPLVIDPYDERVFVRKLFQKDQTAYREVLTQLEKAPTWAAAYELMESLWAAQDRPFYSKESERLKHIFYERYYEIPE